MGESYESFIISNLKDTTSLNQIKQEIFHTLHVEVQDLFRGITEKDEVLLYNLSTESDFLTLKSMCADLSECEILYTFRAQPDFKILSEIGITQNLDVKIGKSLIKKWRISLIHISEPVVFRCIDGEFLNTEFPCVPSKSNISKITLKLEIEGPPRFSESYWRILNSSGCFGPIIWLSMNIV